MEIWKQNPRNIKWQFTSVVLPHPLVVPTSALSIEHSNINLLILQPQLLLRRTFMWMTSVPSISEAKDLIVELCAKRQVCVCISLTQTGKKF